MDWNKASEAMSESLGLKGTYSYTTDRSKADAVLIKDLHIAYDFSDSNIKSAYRYLDYQ